MVISLPSTIVPPPDCHCLWGFPPCLPPCPTHIPYLPPSPPSQPILAHLIGVQDFYTCWLLLASCSNSSEFLNTHRTIHQYQPSWPGMIGYDVTGFERFVWFDQVDQV